MKKRGWFVIMYQEEVELFKNGKSSERLIYEAIKSYSSNGRSETSISNREIASRASISYSTVNRHLPRLIEMGYVEVVGKNGHIGGVINTYKVLQPKTLTYGEVSQTATVSVAISTKSVATVGVRTPKVKGNKINNEIEISQEEQDKLWRILNEESSKEISRQRRAK